MQACRRTCDCVDDVVCEGVGYGRVEGTVEKTKCEGTKEQGTPKSWFTPHV